MAIVSNLHRSRQPTHLNFLVSMYSLQNNRPWKKSRTRGPFLESPETLRAIFGCHNSLCISRTERIQVVKLHSFFSFCYLKNMLKDRLSKTSGWQFHKWLSGPEMFPGLSRNGPQGLVSRKTRINFSGPKRHL